MARVKNPLHSYSASGSIGGTVTYNKVGQQNPRVRITTRDGQQIANHYPSRIVSGAGIAKRKITRQSLASRRDKSLAGLDITTQAQKQRALANASILAAWIVKYNINVGEVNPKNPPQNILPLWDRYYEQHVENREQVKFPGQPANETLSIRRKSTIFRSRHNFMVHQLLTKGFHKAHITAAYASIQPLTVITRWYNSGDAPMHLIVDRIDPGDIGIPIEPFIHIWICVTFESNTFTLKSNWINNLHRAGLWITNYTRPADDPVVLRYNLRLKSSEDIRIETTKPWGKKSQ